jgi:hypothetical protein
VALLAVRGKPHGLMVRRSGFSKSSHVAAGAFRRQSEAIELTDRSDLMTRIAIHSSVRTDQRETVLVFIDVMYRYLPPISVVAKLTLRAILTAMEVSMTILALFRNIAEIEISMAVTTCDHSVSSAQRKFGFRVIELRP